MRYISLIFLFIFTSCDHETKCDYYNQHPNDILILGETFNFSCYSNENLSDCQTRIYAEKGSKKLWLDYKYDYKNDSTGLFLNIHNIIIVSQTESESKKDFDEFWKELFSRPFNDDVLITNHLDTCLKFGNSTFLEVIRKKEKSKTYLFKGIKQNKFILFTVSGCLFRDSVINKLGRQINLVENL